MPKGRLLKTSVPNHDGLKFHSYGFSAVSTPPLMIKGSVGICGEARSENMHFLKKKRILATVLFTKVSALVHLLDGQGSLPNVFRDGQM